MHADAPVEKQQLMVESKKVLSALNKEAEQNPFSFTDTCPNASSMAALRNKSK